MKKLKTNLKRRDIYNTACYHKASQYFYHNYGLSIDLYYENGELIIECRNDCPEAEYKIFNLVMSDEIRQIFTMG
jgi:hypothetical protein